MNIISSKHTTLFLIAAVLVATIFVSFDLYNRNQTKSTIDEITIIQTQSESTEVDAIEKDLMETDLDNLGRELNDIEAELNSVY